jgi:hypothetical protein
MNSSATTISTYFGVLIELEKSIETTVISNKIGDSRAVGSCSSQNQGAIEPAIAMNNQRRYGDSTQVGSKVGF